MSPSPRVVTARHVLGWAAAQGIFTEEHVEQRQLVRPAVVGVPGPWMEVVAALVEAAGEGLLDPTSGMARDPWLYGFEAYVRARCLPRLVPALSLTPEQIPFVMELAAQIQAFFDGTISIDRTGLDGPVQGDLYYHCTFDYRIEIPQWAASRAT